MCARSLALYHKDLQQKFLPSQGNFLQLLPKQNAQRGPTFWRAVFRTFCQKYASTLRELYIMILATRASTTPTIRRFTNVPRHGAVDRHLHGSKMGKHIIIFSMDIMIIRMIGSRGSIHISCTSYAGFH
jgi:hypothetical protein